MTALDRARTRQLEAGTFLTLDNQIDTQTGTIKAKARFANATGTLFPNQFVNVQLLLRTIDGAVVVPVTALRHGPNGDFVYVRQRGRTVALRTVTAACVGRGRCGDHDGLCARRARRHRRRRPAEGRRAGPDERRAARAG